MVSRVTILVSLADIFTNCKCFILSKMVFLHGAALQVYT